MNGRSALASHGQGARDARSESGFVFSSRLRACRPRRSDNSNRRKLKHQHGIAEATLWHYNPRSRGRAFKAGGSAVETRECACTNARISHADPDGDLIDADRQQIGTEDQPASRSTGEYASRRTGSLDLFDGSCQLRTPPMPVLRATHGAALGVVATPLAMRRGEHYKERITVHMRTELPGAPSGGQRSPNTIILCRAAWGQALCVSSVQGYDTAGGAARR